MCPELKRRHLTNCVLVLGHLFPILEICSRACIKAPDGGKLGVTNSVSLTYFRGLSAMILDRIALILTIIGALNWGSIGLFSFDIVAWICGGQGSIFARIIYTVVALAGIWCISLLFRPREEAHAIDWWQCRMRQDVGYLGGPRFFTFSSSKKYAVIKNSFPILWLKPVILAMLEVNISQMRKG